MIAVIQPHIPFYRSDFFRSIGDVNDLNIFTYSNYNSKKIQLKGSDDLETIKIKSYKIGPFIYFSPFKFLKREYKVIVLPFNMILLPVWLVLILSKLFTNRKVVLWGHGISIPNYIKEIQKPHFLKKILVSLADTVWLYTDSEKDYWKKYFPTKEIVSLGNSLTIEHTPSNPDQNALRKKFSIVQPIVLIYCARFNNTYRRIDLLVELISKLDPRKFAFVIIGDGPEKPDFGVFPHVYDFGSVFDNQLKSDLFHLSDVYFQPGWVGLSIVEALKRGLPIFTLERSESIAQCVEYAYLINGYNSIIFDNITSLIETLNSLEASNYREMSNNALLSSTILTVQNMVKQANSTL